MTLQLPAALGSSHHQVAHWLLWVLFPVFTAWFCCNLHVFYHSWVRPHSYLSQATQQQRWTICPNLYTFSDTYFALFFCLPTPAQGLCFLSQYHHLTISGMLCVPSSLASEQKHKCSCHVDLASKPRDQEKKQTVERYVPITLRSDHGKTRSDVFPEHSPYSCFSKGDDCGERFKFIFFPEIRLPLYLGHPLKQSPGLSSLVYPP